MNALEQHRILLFVFPVILVSLVGCAGAGQTANAELLPLPPGDPQTEPLTAQPKRSGKYYVVRGSQIPSSGHIRRFSSGRQSLLLWPPLPRRRRTASGERFNMHEYTAAHKTLPFGSLVRVTNLKNNRSIVVRINDRGPFGWGRVIDLSYAGAKALRLIRAGTAPVRVEAVTPLDQRRAGQGRDI